MTDLEQRWRLVLGRYSSQRFPPPVGQMADMEPIDEISARHGIAVVEDAARAVLAATTRFEDDAIDPRLGQAGKREPSEAPFDEGFEQGSPVADGNALTSAGRKGPGHDLV